MAFCMVDFHSFRHYFFLNVLANYVVSFCPGFLYQSKPYYFQIQFLAKIDAEMKVFSN